MNNPSPLWTPTKAEVETANITRFRRAINARYNLTLKNSDELHRFSIEHADKFWASLWVFAGITPAANEKQILTHKDNILKAKFFHNSKVNFAENMLKRQDRKPAIIHQSEYKKMQSLNWEELYQKTAAMASALQNLGVKAGDRVAAYMPNIPETIIAFLATASLGAVWTSCSPDFGTNGVLDRFGQIAPKILFTIDGYSYAGKKIDLAPKIKEITNGLPSLSATIVTPFLNPQTPPNKTDSQLNFNNLCTKHQTQNKINFAKMDFNDPLFILYSSGTTGKPKCIIHKNGGALLKIISEHQLHSNIKADDRVFFYTTCGWMMWNWLIAALASEATIVLYDGSPTYPKSDSLWDYAEKAKITHFGVSAKYLDAIAKANVKPAQTHNLKSLRCILTTGSPLLPPQFDYVYQHIKKNVHLASISGGTDILGLFVGGDPTKPVHKGEIQTAALGMNIQVFNDNGKPIPPSQCGELVCTRPFPSQPLGLWGDENGQKYHKAYYSRFPNVWWHGDFIEATQNGGYIIHGRSDATLNPGGVRIGTAEIYAQTEALPEIAEAIAIGQKWQGDTRIILFIRLQDNCHLTEELKSLIKHRIRANCSPRHVPAKIIAVPDIPRTRSGKITELAVRDIIHGNEITNANALANPEALAYFANLKELTS